MPKNRFKQLWITECIRLIESNSGRLADAQANAKAKLAEKSVEQRIIKRAHILAKREGILTAQRYFLESTMWSSWALFLVAIFIGSGLALAVLARNPINILWALSGLIGMHSVALLIWLASFWLNRNDNTHLLVRFWIWLTERYTGRSRELYLLPALLSLLSKVKATRWLVGFITHSFWFIILLSATATLLFIFSVKSYQFVWQTTLLSANDFIYIVNWLGYLPSLIGFPLPDAELVIKTGSTLQTQLAEQHVWALWLIGIVVVYGVLVRLLLFVICYSRWKYAIQQSQLDLQQLEYQFLAQQLSPSSESIGVIDPEIQTYQTPRTIKPTIAGSGQVIVAIEVEQLPDLTSLSSSVTVLGEVNDRHQRKSVLEILYLTPAEQLLIICDTKRAPDRGVIHLITELSENAKQTRVWLLQQGDHYQHWLDKLKELDLLQGDLHWFEDSRK